MKTRNSFNVMALFAIVVLALAIIGCEEDKPQEELTVSIGQERIQVKKGEGVSNADYVTTVENLMTALGWVTSSQGFYLSTVITSIGIGGETITFNNGILNIWAKCSSKAIITFLDLIYNTRPRDRPDD